LQAGGQGFETP